MTDQIWIYGDSYADSGPSYYKNSCLNYKTYHQYLEPEYATVSLASGGTGAEWTEHELYCKYPVEGDNNHALILLSKIQRLWLPDIQPTVDQTLRTSITKIKNREYKTHAKALFYQLNKPVISRERWRRTLLGLRYSLQVRPFKQVLIVFCFPEDYLISKPYHHLLDLPTVTLEHRFVMHDIDHCDKPYNLFTSKPDCRPNHMNPLNHEIFAQYVKTVLVQQKSYDPEFMGMELCPKNQTWSNATPIELGAQRRNNQ